MRALVTGACGFVGRYLVEHLLSCGDEVLAGTFQSNHALRVPTVPLDVTSVASCLEVLNRFKPDVIYHLAGIAFVPEAEDNFDRALLVNVGGTNNLYRTCHLLNRGIKILYVSSAEVYGRISPAELPLRETTATRPANNYSLSKLMAEQVAARYDQFGNVHSVIARPFNHIGPGQNDRFVASSFAHQLAQIARGEAPARIRVGNLDACRDFSDVRDIVRGYRSAMERGRGIYNFGSGRAHSIRWLLDTLIEVSGLTVEIETDPERFRAAEVPELYGDISKARVELGWEPRYDLRTTLGEIYQSVIKASV